MTRTEHDVPTTAVRVRTARLDDAVAVHGIYAPIVTDTAISFEVTPPSVAELRDRIGATLAHLPWLVAERDDRVVGFAYAGPFRSRPAYRWSVETTVYIAADSRGTGVGAALYRHLLGTLRELGYVMAFAGITLPNPASEALHERAGFSPIGTYRRAGYKDGAWHDVGWWQVELRPPPDAPEEPGPYRPA